MKKITNLLIIDASGSMQSRTAEVKLGIREFIQDAARTLTDNQVELTTIITEFSSAGYFRALVNTNKLSELNQHIANRYCPDGMTALYDAIGLSFELVPKKQDGVLVSIITDGLENDSRTYSLEKVKSLINKKKSKKKPWIITFIGSSEADLTHSAREIGISEGNILQYGGSGRGFSASISSGIRMKKSLVDHVVSGKAIQQKTFAKDHQVEEK
ncbi:MAG: vWA domain-containing protein [Bacteroidota bacterium]